MAGYLRTKSTDDGRGFRYETKMTALTALRLYKSSNEFYLANNFAKGDKFDDIVYTADIDGEWQTYFVQLKQKQASTLLNKKIFLSALRSKGDFVIKKYYESYKSICKKFKNGGNDVIFSKNFDDAVFVLFTNAYFHDEIISRNPERFNILLETNPGNAVNIKLNYYLNQDVFDGFKIDFQLFEFLNSFYFCSRQANEEDIDLIIQNEIKDLTKFNSDVEIKYVTHELYNFIYAWCKTGQYLTKAHVKNLLSKTSLESQSGKKDDFCFEYVPSFIKHSFDNLKKVQLFLYVSKADSCVMCLNMLKQAGLLNDPNYLSLKQIDKQDIQDHIISEWSSDKTERILVVDCEGDNLNINRDNICGFIKKLMSLNVSKRVMLIATKKNETASEIAEIVGAKTYNFNCSLVHLTDISKKMLMNCEVLFQGYKTKLLSVMSQTKRSLDDVFNMVSMTELLQGRLISVGIKPVEHIPYYVTRVLTRQSAVSSDLFNDPQINACFALSGLSLETAIDSFPCSSNITSCLEFLKSKSATPPKIILLEGDPSAEFIEIAKTISLPLHWFEKSKKGGKLWNWKKSTGGIEKIAKYIESMLDYVATDNIMEISDKIVVVTAEPGMGKSTLLNHLASETKRICPHVWVISIVLNDNTEFLDRKDFVANSTKNTIELLATNAGVNSTTSKFDARLFEECYNSGNMIVLLDGFDEIVPYYTVQGLSLIETLRKSPVSRVWVSARPVLRELLETQTSTLSYTIKPFETKDQRNFLAKYWKSQMSSVSNETLESFINKVLELIEKSFDEKLHQFTGIPLQTKMLAEVFYTDLKNYHDTENLNLKQINGVELFEKFVSIKRGIQLEKAKITVTNAMARYDQQRLDEAREQDLMYLALLTLLPRNKCKNLQPGISDQKAKELKKHVSEGNEKTGIVMSFKGDIPQFIHRTFAEYFTALYFTKYFTGNRDFLSSDDFSTETFDFVKYFFDRILASGQELHEAVLARDEEEVETLLSKGVNVDTLDKGGRTALHVAAAMSHSQSIIKLLIEAGANAELSDDVLIWKPMQYATKLGGMDNIAPILEKTKGQLDKDVIPITWESLLKAVQGDYLQTLLYLIDNGIYSVETLDELSSQRWISNSINDGLTILHLAAAYDSTKILSYFLQKKSRDSKLRLIELKEATGLTPLLLAGSMGKVNAVNCLLLSGANSLVSSPDGKNLIQYAVACRSLEMFGSAVKEASLHKVAAESFLPMAVTTLISDKTEWGSHALQLLFSLYPDLINMKTTKNQPLIVFACMKGNALAVQRLCELGADINVWNVYGTPLHYAVTGGHEDVVRILLASPKIQVDVLDNEESSPLFKAVSKGCVDICQMLIEAGADVNKKKGDKTVLHVAVDDDQVDIVRLLLTRPNIDINAVDNMGISAIFNAIRKGNVEISEILIEAYANLRLITKDGSDVTHAVAQSCSEKLFYYLLVTGFDFNKKNNKDETALSMLQAANADSLVSQLVNPNKVNDLPFEPSIIVADIAVKKRNRRKKTSVTKKEGSAEPAPPVTNNKIKNPPPKPKAPKKPQPQPKAKAVPTEAIYTSDAFLDILKDLKGGNSPQGDDVAEKLKSFINLAITTAKINPQQKKPKVKIPPPPSKKVKNPVQPLMVDGSNPKPNAPSKKVDKKSPPVQNMPKGVPQQKQPPPGPKPGNGNKTQQKQPPPSPKPGNDNKTQQKQPPPAPKSGNDNKTQQKQQPPSPKPVNDNKKSKPKKEKNITIAPC